MHPTAIFAAGFLILFVGGGSRFAIGLTLKPMVTEFGWARGELGIAVGVYLVVSAFATYIAGRLADRTSPRLLLNAGVVVSGLGIGLMCLVGEPWHALVALRRRVRGRQRPGVADARRRDGDARLPEPHRVCQLPPSSPAPASASW